MLSIRRLAIFISFSRRRVHIHSPDAFQEAVKLVSVLKREGLNPWFDDTHPHYDGPGLFQMNISALSIYESFVPIVTRGYAQSIWNLRELYYVTLLSHKMKIFPIELEPYKELEHENAGNWVLNRLQKVAFKRFQRSQCYKIIKALQGDHGMHWSDADFPYLKKDEPDEERKKDLEESLKYATKSIIFEFNYLRNLLIDFIEDQNFSVVRLRRYIKTALEDRGSTLQVALDTYDDIFDFIQTNSSFFNYHLVKYIIRLIEIQKLEDKLDNYEKEFAKYARKRLFQCSSTLDKAPPHTSDIEVLLKVELNLYESSLFDVYEFKNQVCAALEIESHLLRVLKVDDGCVKLVCVTYCHIHKKVFPLSREKKKVLSKLGVLYLRCKDYLFTQVKIYV